MTGRSDPARRDPRTNAASQQPAVIGTGFLLSALGAHSAARYASHVEPLGLTPPHVGLLRAIALGPGRSQQAIADEFGMPPSRMVAFIDELEAKGLVERRRGARDRRVHSLYLTKVGEKMMRQLADVGRAAEEALLGSLNEAERRQLSELLARIASDQNLTPGVHPGYRRMKPDRSDTPPGCD
jgi:DNA-binding MarR family transcriptional regulator